MLVASLMKIPFVRILLDEVDQNQVNALKKKFQYVFLVVYKKIAPEMLPEFQVQHRQTALIDLTLPLEAIFQKFKDNTRNEIRRAQKEDGLSFVHDDKNFAQVYSCYKKFERARKWIPTPRSEMKQHLLFSAYYNGRIISGITCYGHNDILRVAKIFSIRNQKNDEGVKNAIIGYASRNLVYEICQYAKDHGYTRLDLGGVNFDDPVKQGISQFKMSFGSEIVDTSICRSLTPFFQKVKKIFFIFKRDIA